MSAREILTSLRRRIFGDSARTFGIMSVVFLVSLAIAPAKNYFSEWRHYQKQYVKLIRTRADAVTLQRHLETGIQQIWIPEYGVVDRCTTCHAALRETSLSTVSTQPFRPHPAIPHKLTEFGCSTCHRGQGAATTVEEAHRSTLAWEQPILPAKYIESSCGQCHLGDLPGTPQLNYGRKLLAREGCVRCHAVRQPDGVLMQGTDDPPSLVHIAQKTTREWVYAWIKNPQAYSSTATMPNFSLSDDDARDVTAFLMAQSTPIVLPGAEKSAASARAPADPTAGASLYGESFCASCHAVQNAAGRMVGGDVGPELTRIGTKAKPEWLEAWLRNPGAYDPDTAMPHYRFGEQQIKTLARFLEAKTDSDLLANVHLPDPTAQQTAHGKQLVNEYGCASCHEINGVRKPDNFAPDLSHVGSRSLAQLVFAPGVSHTLPDYIAAKVRNPRAFGPSLKMPQFTLTPPQVDAMTTALLALTDRAQSQPASMRIASRQPSHYKPAGHAGQLMGDLRCFSCHAINGRGGDMAPDLTWEGSSVQAKWLADFLKNPNTLRPALIRRMPKFNLTEAEIKELTDYIMTVYQTPAFERDSVPATYPPATVDQGRQLFYSRYACSSCHIVDPAKDKGYIGPTLTQVGSRLTPAWIYHWLKNPQELRPGAIEPNQHMSDDDARALTAYLMSLKGQAAKTKVAGAPHAQAEAGR
ncbi:MAG: c-type cytochrome [Acidobacteriia bacterium]|nr:c-type cytochrome [Terriglobia bacterium]